MKKGIIFFIVLIIIVFGIFYYFLPNFQNIRFETKIACTESGAVRQIIDQKKWKIWWPGRAGGGNVFLYGKYNYRIDKILLNGFDATVFKGQDSAKLNLQIFSYGTDSAQFQWSYFRMFSRNPIKKLIQNFNHNNISQNIRDLATNINFSFAKDETIYGMKVTEEKVRDTALVSLKKSFTHDPSTQDIYNMIGSLRNYIKQSGGKETNFPMLNVHSENSSFFEVMVAIPTQTDLPSKNGFQLKRMVPGNILVAEVKGGICTVKRGEQELENYVIDHKKLSPAISFQSLVTDRISQPDTTKWITKLYYPVF